MRVLDLTGLKRYQLNNVNWNLDDVELNFQLNDLLHDAKMVKLDNSRGNIKDLFFQKMYDFKRDATKQELQSNKIYGGLPLKDERRFNKKTYGVENSQFVGFDTQGEGYLSGRLNKPPQVVLVLKYLDKQQINLANEILKLLTKQTIK